MQTTRNIEKTTRTARQMAEVQRDSYEALAENLAAAQRRTMEACRRRAQVRGVAGAERPCGPGVVRRWREAAAAPAAQRRVRAGLDGRRPGGSSRADRAQRAHRGDLRAERKQTAGGSRDAHPGLGWDLQDFFSPFAYFRESVRTTQQAARQGVGGHRAGSPAGTQGC